MRTYLHLFSRRVILEVKKQNLKLKLTELADQSIDWQQRHIHIYFPEKDLKGKSCVYIGTNNLGLLGGMMEQESGEDQESNSNSNSNSSKDRSRVCKKDEEAFKAFLREQLEQESPYRISGYGNPPNHILHRKYVDEGVEALYREFKDIPCGCEKCKQKSNLTQEDSRAASQGHNIQDSYHTSVNPNITLWQGDSNSQIKGVQLNTVELAKNIFNLFSATPNNNSSYSYYKAIGAQEAQRIGASTQELIIQTRRIYMQRAIEDLRKRAEIDQMLEKIEASNKETKKTSQCHSNQEREETEKIKAFIPASRKGHIRSIRANIRDLKEDLEDIPISEVFPQEIQKDVKYIINRIHTEDRELKEGLEEIKYCLTHPDTAISLRYKYTISDEHLAKELQKELESCKEELQGLLALRGERLTHYEKQPEIKNGRRQSTYQQLEEIINDSADAPELVANSQGEMRVLLSKTRGNVIKHKELKEEAIEVATRVSEIIELLHSRCRAIDLVYFGDDTSDYINNHMQDGVQKLRTLQTAMDTLRPSLAKFCV